MSGYLPIPLNEILSLTDRLKYKNWEYFLGVMRGIEKVHVDAKVKKDKEDSKRKQKESVNKQQVRKPRKGKGRK